MEVHLGSLNWTVLSQFLMFKSAENIFVDHITENICNESYKIQPGRKNIMSNSHIYLFIIYIYIDNTKDDIHHSSKKIQQEMKDIPSNNQTLRARSVASRHVLGLNTASFSQVSMSEDAQNTFSTSH